MLKIHDCSRGLIVYLVVYLAVYLVVYLIVYLIVLAGIGWYLAVWASGLSATCLHLVVRLHLMYPYIAVPTSEHPRTCHFAGLFADRSPAFPRIVAEKKFIVPNYHLLEATSTNTSSLLPSL